MGYYVRTTKILLHRLVHDRACDALERWPTGEARTVAESDVVGPSGGPRDRRYEAFPRLPLLWALEALNIRPEEFSFVDYGAGRGRALLTAARLPFARCVGVEYSAALAAEAADNIAGHPKDGLACRDVAVVHANAVDFEPPPGNLVLFFYNPFGARTLERVAERITAPCPAGPRTIRVVHVNPSRYLLLSRRPDFRKLALPLKARAKLSLLGVGPIDFFAVEGA
ncbi:hypothetical protein A33M_1033 [Rhodovulum sp. PH10]|uniref:hypothetical protein n=1 Tax=Rhodovulum sp. PH10 TaxID=1187851 RepID=UPI00027C1EF3|nr:hypothetical protein [Rhodovulum sp. PH10]EJW09708.1 hypothetical protein A33M_1033 [Rhodovulum sp. PH10]